VIAFYRERLGVGETADRTSPAVTDPTDEPQLT
jgi:hypothetical protein